MPVSLCADQTGDDRHQHGPQPLQVPAAHDRRSRGHAGDPDRPRILQAFNEKTPDWLGFFVFTFFQGRDGKYQLLALAESDFDPLVRTSRFMLTEEADRAASRVASRRPRSTTTTC